MIITRKCMCAAAIALCMLGFESAFAQRSDANTVPYAEAFENLAPWGGSYTNVNTTNGWYSTSADLSTLAYMPYSYSGGLPLPLATHTNVLHLNTYTTILTNSFGGGFDLSTNITYVDTMVKFVPGSQAPTACVTKDSTDAQLGIKAAVYADSNANLVIYCGTVNSFGYLQSNALVNTGIQLSTTNWYRLTIALDATFDAGDLGDIEMFQVALNGVPITNSNGFAFDDGWKGFAATNSYSLLPTPSIGTWFPSSATKAGNARTLTALAFQGSGYIDDLVVSTATPAPYQGNTQNYLLTVVNAGNGSTDFGGTNALTQVLVASGSNTSIVYTAAQWFEIASLTLNGSSVPAALNTSVYTQYLTINGDSSNAVSFFRPTNTITVSAGPNGSANPSGPISLLNGDSTQVVFTALDWYRVATVSPNGSTGGKTATTTFSTLLSNATAAATFGLAPSGSVVALVPSDWALGKGLTEGYATANSAAVQEGYMLNLDPTTMNPALKISALGVSGSNVNVTVLLDNNSVPTNTTIYGTLQLLATANLTNAFAQVGSTVLTGASFTNGGTHVVTFTDVNPTKFYRAEITLP